MKKWKNQLHDTSEVISNLQKLTNVWSYMILHCELCVEKQGNHFEQLSKVGTLMSIAIYVENF